MNRYIDAATLVERLDWARRSGGGFIARCPAHPDRAPSLSVKDGQRGTVLHCHAGCSAKEITGSLGLTVAQLFMDYDPNAGTPGTSIDTLLREAMAKNRPPDIRPTYENPTLLEVMRQAFSGSVEDQMRVYASDEANEMLDMPFTEAEQQWHITADVVVYPYMVRYLEASGRDWFEIKTEAMAKLRRTYQEMRN